jgi:hypothetical protein
MTLCIVDGGHCNCQPDEGMVCDKLPKKVQHYVLTAVKTALEDAIPREIHERLIAEKDAALAELRGYNEREYAVARAAKQRVGQILGPSGRPNWRNGLK